MQAANFGGTKISAPKTEQIRLAVHRLERLLRLDLSIVECALAYAEAGISVFPCKAGNGPDRKKPLTEHGFYDATRDPQTIKRWWKRWPDALIGARCGLAGGFVVFDIDIKHGVNGFDSLSKLGFTIPSTALRVHTASGGLHLWFDPQGRKIASSVGIIGPGLDWRAEGGLGIQVRSVQSV
jgi:hypothetical protein